MENTAFMTCMRVPYLIIGLFLKKWDWFNINMRFYPYKSSYCGDTTIFYLHNGITKSSKIAAYIEWGPWLSSLMTILANTNRAGMNLCTKSLLKTKPLFTQKVWRMLHWSVRQWWRESCCLHSPAVQFATRLSISLSWQPKWSFERLPCLNSQHIALSITLCWILRFPLCM